MRGARAPLILSLAGALAALPFAVQSGCVASQCTQPKHASGATPTFECPSGQVCYEGECRQACNAGLEGATPCNFDSDCSGATPNCSAGFCSSCGGGQSCVPQLNICQRVAGEESTDGGPLPSMGLPPPPPLDGGYIDGSVFAHDASVTPPVQIQALTHLGTVTLEQVTDFSTNGPNATEQGQISVEFFDLRQARTTTGTPMNQLGNCEIDRIQHINPMTPADVGTVKINTASGSNGPALNTASEVDSAFQSSSMAYAVTMPTTGTPNPLLNLSKIGDDRLIVVSSPGAATVTSPWPFPSFSYHVPYALTPSAGTLAMLRNPMTLGSPPADITFAWTLLVPPGGRIPGEHVVAELQGQDYTLHCELDETLPGAQGSLTMKSKIISQFMAADGLTAGSNRTAKVFFGRVDEAVMPIPGTSNTAVQGTLRIADAFIGSATP